MVTETAYSLIAYLKGCLGTGSTPTQGASWSEGRLFLHILEGILPEEVIPRYVNQSIDI